MREALRAILRDTYPGARVLDLFAGTGALGLDALEGGAAEVVFVEAHRRAAAELRKRGLSVVAGRLPEALKDVSGQFDLVLADPPYGAPEGPATLAALAPRLAPGALAVFEHHHKDPYPDRLEALELEQRRRYGETALSFYRTP
ncbi:MAG: RsmD family RNA methyltransferase [Candidatus Eremiobacterota bacterium]